MKIAIKITLIFLAIIGRILSSNVRYEDKHEGSGKTSWYRDYAAATMQAIYSFSFGSRDQHRSGVFTQQYSTSPSMSPWSWSPPNEYCTCTCNCQVPPCTAAPSFNPTTRNPSVATTAVTTTLPTAKPTVKPSHTPSLFPTYRTTKAPTHPPTIFPSTKQPTFTPSVTPSRSPSYVPSTAPVATKAPTYIPTTAPKSTYSPSVSPSHPPSFSPSIVIVPTYNPSATPFTKQPTYSPSITPVTHSPTYLPSAVCTTSSAPSTTTPTDQPTLPPTWLPSALPSCNHTYVPLSTSPTLPPSKQPATIKSTVVPSFQPSVVVLEPSSQPSSQPSDQPSTQPSGLPTNIPTAFFTIRVPKPTQPPLSSQPTFPSAPVLETSELPTYATSQEPSVVPTTNIPIYIWAPYGVAETETHSDAPTSSRGMEVGKDGTENPVSSSIQTPDQHHMHSPNHHDQDSHSSDHHHQHDSQSLDHHKHDSHSPDHHNQDSHTPDHHGHVDTATSHAPDHPPILQRSLIVEDDEQAHLLLEEEFERVEEGGEVEAEAAPARLHTLIHSKLMEKSIISDYGIGGRWIGHTKSPILLSTVHDAFAEVDEGQSEDFEFSLSSFSSDDVLTISIFCVTLEGSDFSVNNRKKVIGTDFSPLLFDLYYISPYPTTTSTTSFVYHGEGDEDGSRERIPVQPRLLNGQYCITLCASHGIRKGSYILSINLDSSKKYGVNRLRAQTIRLQRRICPIVRAIPLEQGATFKGQVSDMRMSHFRFISNHPSKAISVAIRSVSNADTKRKSDNDLTWMNSENDIELYVTNRGDGLVGVTKDDCVWRAITSTSARVDILPGDINNPGKSYPNNGAEFEEDDDGANNDPIIYMIGVAGSVNGVQYELSVRETYPEKITSLPLTDVVQYDQGIDKKKPNNLEPQPRSSYHFNHDRIEPGQYQYYSIPISSAGVRVGDEIAVVVSCNKDISELRGTRLVQRMGKKESLESRYEVNTACGRAVFTADTFSIYGARGPILGSSDKQTESNSNLSSDSSNSYHEEVKDSSYSGTLFPVVYISQTCKYPTAEDYTWRASGWDGTAVFFVDQREFSQMGMDTCYFSVFGFDCALTNFLPPENVDDLVKYWPKTAATTEGVSAVDGVTKSSASKESKCVLYLHTDSLLYRYSQDDFVRYSIFEDLFGDVNGHLLSQKDREASLTSLWEDEQMFAYSEIDFVSFQDILQQAGAVDGQIFYDLGAGCGKAVAAAALSNRVRFLKTVGIELLPSLCFCASAVVSAITSQPVSSALVSNNLSHIQPSNRSFIPSPRGAMGNTYISSGNNNNSRMNNNVFLKSFKSAVLKSLQKSFVSEDSHANDSYIQSGQDLQPDEAKNAIKAYVLENKEGGANETAELDKASELPLAMNVSSIHSEQSITSAHYVNTGKEAERTSLLLASAKNNNQLLSGKIVEDAIKSATSLFSIPKNISSKIQAAKIRLPITEIRFGDVMDGEMDWSDGDFIFLSGYSFQDDLLSAVFDKARALKMGSKVVTLSLPEDKDKLYRSFDLVKSFPARMSWGKVMVYVLVRKNNRALLFTEVPYFTSDEYNTLEANAT